MRIGIEAQRLLRKNKHGIDIVALNVLKNLSSVDTINEYVLFTRNGEDVSCLSSIKNIRIVILPAFTYADWEQIQLPRAVRKEKIDILHCTSSTAPLFVSVPIVLTVHDVICFERPFFGEQNQSLYQRLGNAYRTVVSRRAMANAEKIVTVSEFERNQIISRFPELQKKVSVIHNGVDTQFFSSVNEKTIRGVRKQYGLPRSYFLHFGNSDPKKNTEFVIRSFIAYASAVKSMFPLVITDVPRSIVEQFLIKYSAGHLSRHIFTPGYVQYNDLPGVYANALALLFPSKRESFGLPILEAMASDVPVISSRTSSLPEIAGEAALYIGSEDPLELAERMLFVQNNIQETITVVRKGRDHVIQYQWLRTSIAYANQYSSFRHETNNVRRESFNYIAQPNY